MTSEWPYSPLVQETSTVIHHRMQKGACQCDSPVYAFIGAALNEHSSTKRYTTLSQLTLPTPFGQHHIEQTITAHKEEKVVDTVLCFTPIGMPINWASAWGGATNSRNRNAVLLQQNAAMGQNRSKSSVHLVPWRTPQGCKNYGDRSLKERKSRGYVSFGSFRWPTR